MEFSHISQIAFDDPNLMTSAGLVPVIALADRAGLARALGSLTVDSPNRALKAQSVIAGMIAGADSIDDLDVLRAGANPDILPGVRAPSTLGTFLRRFSFGHVRQPGRANRDILPGMARRARGLIAGSASRREIAFIDLDDSVIETFGHHKQACGYGYSKVLGMNLMLATLSNPTTPPVILAGRLRKGKTASGHHGDRMLAEAAETARPPGRGQGPGHGPGRLRLLQLQVPPPSHRGPSVVLRDLPAEQTRPPGHRLDPRRRLDADQVPGGRLGRRRAPLGLRRRGRRDPLHRVRLEAPPGPGRLPTGRATRQTAQPGQEPGSPLR